MGAETVSELIEQPLLISGDRVPVAAYQAIYHKLTGKTEKLTEIFPDAYQIEKSDICQLNHIIEQSLVQYNLSGKRCEIVLSLRKNESFQFSGFSKFESFSTSTTSCTSRVNIEYDFFIVLPTELKEANEVVQRFKVNISIDQDFVEENDQNLPDFVRSVMSGNNIGLSIDYSDYAVARALQGAVRDWVSSLSQRKKPAWISFVDRSSDFIVAMLPRFMATSVFIGAALHVKSVPVSTIHNYLFSVLSLAAVMYISGAILAVQFFRQLSVLRPLSFLLITKGDKDRKRSLDAKSSKKTGFALFICATVIVGLLVNIISSFMYDWLSR